MGAAMGGTTPAAAPPGPAEPGRRKGGVTASSSGSPACPPVSGEEAALVSWSLPDFGDLGKKLVIAGSWLLGYPHSRLGRSALAPPHVVGKKLDERLDATVPSAPVLRFRPPHEAVRGPGAGQQQSQVSPAAAHLLERRLEGAYSRGIQQVSRAHRDARGGEERHARLDR